MSPSVRASMRGLLVGRHTRTHPRPSPLFRTHSLTSPHISVPAASPLSFPQGVKSPMELSTYFRINAQETGQFERTLIVAEEGAYVSYLEVG